MFQVRQAGLVKLLYCYFVCLYNIKLLFSIPSKKLFLQMQKTASGGSIDRIAAAYEVQENHVSKESQVIWQRILYNIL